MEFLTMISDYPPEVAEIYSSFQGTGLLIRTLQFENVFSEFSSYGKECCKLLNDRFGLLKWSLTHSNLLPQYHYMSHESSPIYRRHIAVLAMPSRICRFIEGRFYSKDAASGTLQEWMCKKTLGWEGAKISFQNLYNELKNNYPQITENNEVQTAGINLDAIVGLMYWEEQEDWYNKMKEFQRLIDKFKQIPNFKTLFPIFTYEKPGNRIGTTLKYLGCLKANS